MCVCEYVYVCICICICIRDMNIDTQVASTDGVKWMEELNAQADPWLVIHKCRCRCVCTYVHVCMCIASHACLILIDNK